MNNIETKVFLETRLRNLKRKQAKLRPHGDLGDMYLEITDEIHKIEEQLAMM